MSSSFTSMFLGRERARAGFNVGDGFKMYLCEGHQQLQARFVLGYGRASLI